MSCIRSILVHVDAAPRCAARLLLADQLGLQHDAAVTALFAVTSSYLEYPLALGADASLALVSQQLDDERRAQARAYYDAAAHDGKPPTQWAELAGGAPVAGFAQQALCADLLVLGQHQPQALQGAGVPADFVQSVLMASGRPALVIPYVGDAATIGRNVLVAWKATPESAHALSAAVPLMRGAQQVHVACWDEEAAAGPAAALDVVQYLRLHGITATLHHHGKADRQLGESLLSLAADLAADLLVMGCYGHSRARELVLGGVTRSILASMTLPVLMAH